MLATAATPKSVLEAVQLPRTPYISPDATGNILGVNKGRLAEIVGLHRNSFRNPRSNGVQNALREIIRILSMAEDLCGDTAKALFWFNNEPLRDYRNKTPAELCADGQQRAVIAFLAEIEHGANG